MNLNTKNNTNNTKEKEEEEIEGYCICMDRLECSA